MSRNLNRFLIVDRAEPASRVFSSVGRRLGYTTDIAATLTEFVETLDDNAPTVVLVDLQSVENDVSGYLKALRRAAGDAVVLLTGDGRTRALATATQLADVLGLSVIASERSIVSVRNELRRARLPQTQMSASEMAAAIAADDIRPNYQPQAEFRARCGWTISGIEALPFWHLGETDAVPPAEFLPLAEDSGQLALITRRLLEQVIEQLRAWRSQRIFLDAAVKLSAPSLEDGELADDILQLVRRAQLEPGILLLEVPEALAMSHSIAAIEALGRLKANGFRLAIDEFGTAYSSIEQLCRLKVDELRLDASLVQESRISGETRRILEAAVALAQKLGLLVCADGVDSERSLNYLARIGCNKVQGCYIGKPLRARSINAYINDWNRRGVAGITASRVS
ncbi:MAG TPA: EAL domain-containing response regulator [Woeseiaceae bacterium]|nr:EAL domain-containing response regulator [Woeseiaceae bacterium]